MPGAVDVRVEQVAGLKYLRITPDRRVETVVADPVPDRLNRPTNVAFAPGSTRLCFANLGGFSVNAVDVGEQGMPLRYPRL